jgi:hypothetical protein
MNPADLYADDPTIRQNAGGDWEYFPNHPVLKTFFLVFSLALLVLGGWLIEPPLSRWLTGQTSTARVVEILREEPGKEPERIRYRKEIHEGNHLTTFTYTVAVPRSEGGRDSFIMAVGSRRAPYANVNDEFRIIYFAEDNHAYGLLHHRTWAFGVGFLFIGGLLTLCAVPTLLAVGKPILIDPEGPDPEVMAESMDETEASPET